MRSIAILGSTGSVGRNTLEVLHALGDDFKVVGLAARQSIDLLEQQIRKFMPRLVSVAEAAAASELKQRFNRGEVEILSGPDSAIAIATMAEADLVLASMVGAVGLLPTFAAIEAGKDVVFANKEILVMGGSIVMTAVKRHQANMLPVDSEISAIFQCLESNRRHSDIQRILLTGSGGPFRKTSREQLEQVTVEQALNHPNWNMGAKITIDSATLMNKAFEVIEAKWLFDLSYDQIEVIIHPESIVHSMVEFVDGSVLAQLGVADMRVPIQYALTYPYRAKSPAESLNLIGIGNLHFEEVDLDRFPCLKHAYSAMAVGGTMPAVLNGANEVAVRAFLDRQIPFSRIPTMIAEVMHQHEAISEPSLDQVLAADYWARETANKCI